MEHVEQQDDGLSSGRGIGRMLVQLPKVKHYIQLRSGISRTKLITNDCTHGGMGGW